MEVDNTRFLSNSRAKTHEPKVLCLGSRIRKSKWRHKPPLVGGKGSTTRLVLPLAAHIVAVYPSLGGIIDSRPSKMGKKSIILAK
jgi:hypothetical protein